MRECRAGRGLFQMLQATDCCVLLQLPQASVQAFKMDRKAVFEAFSP